MKSVDHTNKYIVTIFLTSSEGHLRQMKLFSDNSGSILDEFSREFEHGYLQALSHLHGTKRVLANRVYQEYIADKHHVHMNATIWTSLAGFCKHLGKDGKAIVDETEKGWYIQYIDRDPKVLARQKDMEERKRSELDDDERSRRLIETQIKISQQSTNDDVPIPEDEQDTKIEQNVGLVFNSGISLKRKIPSLFEADDDGDDSVEEDLDKNSKGSHLKMKYAGTFAEISASKDESADITACPKLWLHKGIIVKVLSNVDSDFVNMKGEVESISLEPPGAVVKFTDKLKYFSQDKLQTVVPKVISLQFKIILMNI